MSDRVFKMNENGEEILPKVSRKEFKAYVEVQRGGETNMWHYDMVDMLSDGVVTKEGHIYIIQNYADLSRYYDINMENIYDV